MLNIGEVNELKVKRKTDIGYMLYSESDEVFLHNNESNHQILKEDDVVLAFLYFDQKGRLAATLKAPIITMTNPGFLTASDVSKGLGVFMNNGIAKDVLLSKDYLPYNEELWPQKGDTVYCVLKLKTKLTAKLANMTEIELKPKTELEIGKKVFAYIQKIGSEGNNLLTGEGHIIFVHHTQARKTNHLGEKVEVKITYLSDQGYVGSLIENKEIMLFDDANRILTYLIRRGGTMPFDSDSNPEKIDEAFGISKKAFKRALGTLYRERKVEFSDGNTILIVKDEVKDSNE